MDYRVEGLGFLEEEEEEEHNLFDPRRPPHRFISFPMVIVFEDSNGKGRNSSVGTHDTSASLYFLLPHSRRPDSNNYCLLQHSRGESRKEPRATAGHTHDG